VEEPPVINLTMGLLNSLKKSIFGRSTISLYTRGFGVSERIAGGRAFNAYKNNLVVFSAVNKRAEKVGQIQFQLFRGETEITSNPILDLLERPNEYQSKNEFFELYQKMKDLTGSVFVWKYGIKNGLPESLYVLRSDKMKIHATTEGDIKSFEYKIDNGKVITFEPDDILFSQYADPAEHLAFSAVGLPLAGSSAISTYTQLDVYQENLLRNGGKVDGIIKIPADSITKDDLDALKESFSAERAGADKAGLPYFLYGGMEYEDLGKTPKELSFTETRKDLRDDIAMLFGVPKVLLGQTENVNYGSAEVAHQIFLRETIKPLLDNLVQKLNYFLVPEPYDLRYIDPTPDNIDEKLKIAENASRFNWLTPNEVRKLMGFEEIEGGDELRTREPRTIEVSPEAPEEKKIKTNEWVHPLSVKATRDIYRREVRAKQDANEMNFKRAVDKFANEQEKRILNYVGATPKNWKAKNIIDDAFNINLELTAGINIFKPLLEALALQAGKEYLELLNVDREYKLSDAILTTLDKRVHFFVREINNTTYQELQNAFAESLAEGESRKDLVKRIRDVYDGYTDKRANTIARTETHTAVQSANHDSAIQARIPTKVWTAVVDDRTRDSHLELDGMVIGINETYPNGLLFPGDPNGSAEETINCRCG